MVQNNRENIITLRRKKSNLSQLTFAENAGDTVITSDLAIFVLWGVV
jgi:hypothetical protein